MKTGERSNLVKIIHQTWKTVEIPNQTYPRVWQESWKIHNPDWEYRLWTDEDNERLVRDHYPQFLKGYRTIDRGVIKSDIARALYMHKYGGMYADLDFVCLRSFGGLLQALSSSIVIGRHGNDQQPRPNAWFYSPAGIEFWNHLVTDALHDWAFKIRTKPEEVAGPDRLDWCLEKYKPDHAELPTVTIYPHAWGNRASNTHAQEIDWLITEKLEAAYPNSLAVTSWAHNW